MMGLDPNANGDANNVPSNKEKQRSIRSDHDSRGWFIAVKL
jgi:hypothetical protein